MNGRILRVAIYAACALVPAAYVFAKERAPESTPRLPPARGGFGAGYFPDIRLTTHEGTRVRLYEDLLRDKVVVINFMYARCDGICPGTTKNLRRVQDGLGDAVGRDVFFYSFTLKPDEDTPEALDAYAKANGVKPGWLFLTGAAADLELLRRTFGFVDPDPAIDAQKRSHIGVVLYGNVKQQQWAACPSLSNPDVLLEQIRWLVPKDSVLHL